MPRNAQPLDAEREAALIAEAVFWFARVGYEQASLNAIISAAGWSKSSFYHYFPDKRQLHDHVVTTLRSRVLARLTVPVMAQLTPTTFWPAVFEVIEQLLNEPGEPSTALLLQLLQQPLAVRGPEGELSKLRTELRDWLAQLLDQGRALGVVRTDVAIEAAVEWVMAVMLASVQLPTGPGVVGVDPGVVGNLVQRMLQPAAMTESKTTSA